MHGEHRPGDNSVALADPMASRTETGVGRLRDAWPQTGVRPPLAVASNPPLIAFLSSVRTGPVQRLDFGI
jgi:hypothetical protein